MNFVETVNLMSQMCYVSVGIGFFGAIGVVLSFIVMSKLFSAFIELEEEDKTWH